MTETVTTCDICGGKIQLATNTVKFEIREAKKARFVIHYNPWEHADICPDCVAEIGERVKLHREHKRKDARIKKYYPELF